MNERLAWLALLLIGLPGLLTGADNEENQPSR